MRVTIFRLGREQFDYFRQGGVRVRRRIKVSDTVNVFYQNNFYPAEIRETFTEPDSRGREWHFAILAPRKASP